jgi:hypothetical protein
MSALAVAALVLVCVWLGALTLVAVLLVRQVGLLTVVSPSPARRSRSRTTAPKSAPTYPRT